MSLTDYEEKILLVLPTDSGFQTGDIADRVWPVIGDNRRQHAVAIRALLLGLEAKGLVRKLDSEKPVCWTKVAR